MVAILVASAADAGERLSSVSSECFSSRGLWSV